MPKGDRQSSAGAKRSLLSVVSCGSIGTVADTLAHCKSDARIATEEGGHGTSWYCKSAAAVLCVRTCRECVACWLLVRGSTSVVLALAGCASLVFARLASEVALPECWRGFAARLCFPSVGATTATKELRSLRGSRLGELPQSQRASRNRCNLQVATVFNKQ